MQQWTRQIVSDSTLPTEWAVTWSMDTRRDAAGWRPERGLGGDT